MTRKVMVLSDKHSQGSATLVYELMDLLNDWLRHHVATLDRDAFS